MLDEYRIHQSQRAGAGVPPLPLSAGQVQELIHELQSGEDPARTAELRYILAYGVAPGVDDAARYKAGFLSAVASGAGSVPGHKQP